MCYFNNQQKTIVLAKETFDFCHSIKSIPVVSFYKHGDAGVTASSRPSFSSFSKREMLKDCMPVL
jgi:hypothetical protein